MNNRNLLNEKQSSLKLHQTSLKDDKYVPIQKAQQHVAKPPFLSAKRADKLSKLTKQSSTASLSNTTSTKVNTNSTTNQNDYYKIDEDDEFKNESNGRFELVHYVEPVYDEFLSKQQKLSYQKNLKNQPLIIEPKQKFVSYLVAGKLYEIMKDLFQTKCSVYEPNDAKSCCRILSDQARLLAKSSIKLDRYKFVVNTIVMQKCGQSAILVSRPLFCMTTDGYASQTYETKDYIVNCLIYAIYHE